MKKIYISLLICACILFVNNAHSQRHGKKYLLTMIGGGYNQVNVKASGLNYIIDQFNQTRRLVGDQAMANIETPTGFSGFLGTYGYLGTIPFLLEFRYGGAGQTLAATQRPAGQPPVNTELRFNMHNIQVGFGVMATSSQYFGIGLGIAPDIGIHIINDKASTGNTELINHFTFGTSFILPVYAMLGPVMLGIRPYYTLQLGTNDYADLNATLNPNTYQTNPADEQISNLSHFGIEFRVGLLLSKRERR